MPRRARVTPGGLLYHVLNRTVAGLPLSRKKADYEAFASDHRGAQATTLDSCLKAILSDWPVRRSRNWVALVNKALNGQTPRCGHVFAVLTERWKLVQPCDMDLPQQHHIRDRYAEPCRLPGRVREARRAGVRPESDSSVSSLPHFNGRDRFCNEAAVVLGKVDLAEPREHRVVEFT